MIFLIFIFSKILCAAELDSKCNTGCKTSSCSIGATTGKGQRTFFLSGNQKLTSNDATTEGKQINSLTVIISETITQIENKFDANLLFKTNGNGNYGTLIYCGKIDFSNIELEKTWEYIKVRKDYYPFTKFGKQSVTNFLSYDELKDQCFYNDSYVEYCLSLQTPNSTKLPTQLPTASKSKEFTNSQTFSKSSTFSNSQIFSKSSTYSNSNSFSESRLLSNSYFFSNSKLFSNTEKFSNSNYFSNSKYFSNSCLFSKSNEFTKSTLYTSSNKFTNSDVFTRSNAFTQSNNFSLSNIFTKSNAFSDSKTFSNSDTFLKSSSFSLSSAFTSSDKFTKSNYFTKSNVFIGSKSFSSSQKFTSSNQFTQSSTFSSAQKFSSSSLFSSSEVISYSSQYESSSDQIETSNEQNETNSEQVESSSKIEEIHSYSEEESTNSADTDRPNPDDDHSCMILVNGKNFTLDRCSYSSHDSMTFVEIIRTNFIQFVNESHGGAIYLKNCGLECIHANFTECSSLHGGGGALYIKNNQNMKHNITICNSNFLKCTAVFGGACYIYSGSDENIVLFDNCSFISNTLIDNYSYREHPDLIGRNSVLLTAKNAKITSCKFYNNKGKNGNFRIYNKFDEDIEKEIKQLNDEKTNSFSFLNCLFNQENNDSSNMIFLVAGEYKGEIEINGCRFKGNLKKGTHYIDGKLLKDFQRLQIKTCQFDSDLKKAVNSKLIEGFSIKDEKRHLSSNFVNIYRINLMNKFLYIMAILSITFFIVLALRVMKLIIIRNNSPVIDNSTPLDPNE